MLTKRIRRAAALLTAALLAVSLAGCDVTEKDEAPSDALALPFAGVQDQTDAQKGRAYSMTVPKDDHYTFTCEAASALTLYKGGKKAAEGTASVEADLAAGDTVTVSVATGEAEAPFELEIAARDNPVTLPYENAFSQSADGFDLTGNPDEDPLEPARVDYQKREGGTYVFSNNPELLAPDDLGQALLRNEGLTGEVYFTFEHANYANKPLTLGYQLKNTGDSDVYVTVTNIGYQTGGEWFGQQCWSDVYNTRFELPKDYFVNGSPNGKYTSQDLAFIDYTPRVFRPTTYRLPAGESFYVLGGTSADAYRRLNVAATADKTLATGKCANGTVKFAVTGGAVTGTFYCYTDPAQVAAEPAEQGYVTKRGGKDYSAQYKGTDPHQGLVENNMVWTVNDLSPAGNLPVTYTNAYDTKAAAVKTPYAAYSNKDYTVEKASTWMTHLNPQVEHKAVGMDLMDFACRTPDGKEVVIDNNHADGGGNPANTANWMVEYHDNFTFVNQGDSARTFKLYLKDNGALATLVRDADGTVLESLMTMGKGKSDPLIYTLEVAPHSVGQVTLDYLMLACSYGNVTHWVTMA